MVYVRLFCGIVGILLIVYLLAEITPKLAKFADKHLGGEKSEPHEILPEEYTVQDPYEGDLNNQKKSEEKE